MINTVEKNSFCNWLLMSDHLRPYFIRNHCNQSNTKVFLISYYLPYLLKETHSTYFEQCTCQSRHLSTASHPCKCVLCPQHTRLVWFGHKGIIRPASSYLKLASQG